MYTHVLSGVSVRRARASVCACFVALRIEQLWFLFCSAHDIIMFCVYYVNCIFD